MTPLFPHGITVSRLRPCDSVALRYGLVILVSLLLHGGLWQFRHWFEARPEALPKPKPPIEVILAPVPAGPAPAVAPAPPAPVMAAPASRAPPARAKPAPARPLTPRPAPAARPAPPAPKAEPPRPRVEPPPPRAAPPEPRPVRPTRRELEEDPNLPALRPREPVIERRIEPAPPVRPRPAPSPARQEPPARSPVSSTPARGADTAAAGRAPGEATRAATSGSTAAGARPGPAAGGVDRPAQANAAYLHNPKPEYPALAKRRQWEGRVLLKVRVLAKGTVAAVSVATSSGHDVLDEAALEAVRQWHFVPAQRGGQAVDSWVNVPINFNLLASP